MFSPSLTMAKPLSNFEENGIDRVQENPNVERDNETLDKMVGVMLSKRWTIRILAVRFTDKMP